MLVRTHLIFGILLFLILFIWQDGWWFFLIGCVLGVLIVDLDSKKSWLGQSFLGRPFQLFFKHRGVLHSLFFGVFLSLIFAVINLKIGFGFLIGFFSHLLLDFFTHYGVMIFWPFSKKRFGLGLKSGGIIEDIIFVLILILVVLLVGFYLFGLLKIL